MSPDKKIISTDGKALLTAKSASKRLKCAADYVGKLCREGKLEGRLVDGAWFVSHESIAKFEKARIEARASRSRGLTEQRKEESALYRKNYLPEEIAAQQSAHPFPLAQLATTSWGRPAALAFGAAFLFAAIVFAGGSSGMLQGVLGDDAGQSASLAQVQSPFFAGTATEAYSPATASNTSGGSNFFSDVFAYLFGAHPVQVAHTTPAATPATVPVVAVAPQAPIVTPATAPATPAKSPAQTIVENNTYPVTERTVVETQSGISQADLTSQLDALSNNLKQFVYSNVNNAPAGPVYSSGGYTNNTALATIIDQLNNVAITGGSITNANISGGTISGLTGLDLASGCVSVGGVCLSSGGNAAGATGAIQFNTGGAFDASSTQFVWDAVNDRLGIGTSTPQHALSLGAGGVISITSNDGASNGCFAEIGGQLEYANDCNTYQSFTASAAGGWTDTGSVVHLTTGAENVAIGTTTPYAKLTVWGSGTGAENAFAVVNNASTTVFAINDAGQTTLQSLFATGSTTLQNVTEQNVTELSATSTSLYTATLGLGVGNYFTSLLGGGLVNNNGTLSIGTVGVGSGGTGTTTAPSYGQLLVGNSAGGYDLLATSSLGIISNGASSTFGTTSIFATAPLNWNTANATLSITQAGLASDGYLSSADYATFNNKISSSSLSSANGYLTYNAATGVFTASTSPTYANATTTNFAITGVSGSLLKTLSDGAVVAAVAGVDYATPGGGSAAFPFTPTTFGSSAANATSTLTGFTNGLYALGSSTIANLSFGNGTTTNLVVSNLFADSTGTTSITGNLIPSVADTYTLGSLSNPFQSMFVGAHSLYVNGEEVIQTDVSKNVIISSSPNENLELQTSGNANLVLQPSTSGLLQVEGGLQIAEPGNNITTSNSSALPVPFGIAAGNITVSGNSVLASNLNGGISLTPNGSGGTYVTAGDFGIGTTSPTNKLEVNGASYLGGNVTITGNTTAGQATTTNLAISTVTSSLLKTLSDGAVVAAVAGTDYQAAGSYATFAYPFSSNATSSQIAFNGGATFAGATTTSFAVTGSTTITGNAYFGSTVTLGALAGSGTDCVQVDTNGTLSSTGAACGTGGGGAVNSVSNSDGTLTISPSTGAVVASLNLAHANTFSALQQFTGGLFATNASTTNATTTSFAITNVTSSLLKTLSNGAVVAAVAGTDYENPLTFVYPLQRSTNTISTAFGTTTANTFSSLQTLNGGLAASTITANTSASLASTTLTGNTLLTNATTTSFAITNVSNALLKTLSNGAVVAAVAGADYATPAAAYPFTATNNYGVNTSATSTPLYAVNGLFASSTSHFANADFGSATSSNFAIANILNGLLSTNANGTVVATTSLSTNYLTGTLAVSNGGTGSTTLTGILGGNGTSAVKTIAIGSGLTFDGTTLATNGAGITSIGPLGQTQTGGTQLFATSTTGSDFTITASGNTQTFNLPFASPAATGKLAATDFTTFENKISSSSLSGQSVISYNSSTGVITTTGGTFSSGNYVFPSNVAASSASTTLLSATNGAFFGLTATSSFAQNGALTLAQALSVANGGTGNTSYPLNSLLYFDGSKISATSSSALYVGSVVATTTTATSTLQGGLAVANSLFVLQNGNVGLGNSTPQKTFDVTGTGRFSSTLTLSANASCTGGQALQTDVQGNVSCGTIVFGGLSNAGGWSTNNTGIVTLATTSDEVAVGATSTPYAKFTILSGGAATTTLALVPASGQTANIIDIYNSAGALNSVLTAGGNLGLGTTSPFARLSVAGNGFFNGNITGANVTATGTLAVGSTLAVGTSTLITTAAGNLGLGTTSATAHLTISGGDVNQYAAGNPILATSTAAAVGGHSYKTVVSGNYAYEADNEGGLRIFDVTNPQNPLPVGSYVTGGNEVEDVTVAGKYAYLADAANGVEIVDVSNPSSPALVGSYTSVNLPRSVALSGKYLYVADENNHAMRILDVSNPANPTLVGSFSTGGSGAPFVIAVSGKYAYIGDYSSALFIVDISNPANPVQVKKYTSANVVFPSGLYLSGKNLFVADAGGTGLYILNVANPAVPTVAGTYNPGSSQSYWGVAVAGTNAYIADSNGNIDELDITNIANPVLTGSYSTGGAFARGVYLDGKYAYVSADSSGMQTIDINGLTTPAANIGSLATNIANISDSLSVGGDSYFGGGLDVGVSGVLSRGALGVLGSTTLSTLFTTGSTTIGGAFNSLASNVLASTTLGGNTLLTNATTTSLFASVASTTNLTIGNLLSTLLKTTATGQVVAAVANTDYTTPSALAASVAAAYPFGAIGNATSTLTQFNAGLTAYASSTIGNGTQNGGLTISGGATTTGSSYIGGNAIIGGSVFSSGIVVALSTSNSFFGNGTTGGIQIGDSIITKTAGSAFQFNSGINTITGGNGTPSYSFSADTATGLYLPSTGNLGFDVGAFGEVARFSGANLGLGTTSPFAQLSVFAGGDYAAHAASMLFAIGSTTAGTATTTLFSVNSAGLATLTNLLTTGSTTLASLLNIGGALNANGALAVLGGTSLKGATSTSFAVTGSTTISGAFNSVVSNLLGSTTLLGNSLFSFATTTNLAITGTANTLLKTLSNGAVVAAIANTDYTTPSALAASVAASFEFTPTTFGSGHAANATSTLIGFTNGLYALASSTIGNGAQGGGLTISGGATTTGNAYFATGATINSNTIFGPDLTLNTSNSTYQTAIQFQSAGVEKWDIGTDAAGNGTKNFFIYDKTNAVFPLFVNTNDNVGIGSTSPFAKFSINANNGDTNTTLFAIGSSTQSATSTLFSISNTGNVGIGKSSSANTVEIYDSASTPGNNGLHIQGNYNEAINFGGLTTDNIGGIAVQSNNSPNQRLQIRGLQGLGFYVGSDYSDLAVTINSSGNVGIGTTSPFATLSVQGNGYLSGNLTAANITATGTLAVSGLSTLSGGLLSLASSTIGNGTQTGGLTISGGATTTGNSFIGGSLSVGSQVSGGDVVGIETSNGLVTDSVYSDFNGRAFFGYDGNTTNAVVQGVGSKGIEFNVNNSTFGAGTAAVITSTGNFGIGTTSPFATLSVAGNAFITGGATTTNLAITGITSSLLKTLSDGAVVAAVAGTDYVTPAALTAATIFPFTPTTFGSGHAANATSTLIGFTNGLYALASSTIGNGTQGGGLTISGGATTTGNAYFANNVSIGPSLSLPPVSFSDSISSSANVNAIFQNTSSSGYSGFALFDNNAADQGALAYANTSASLGAGGITLFTNAKNFTLSNSLTSVVPDLVMNGTTGNIGVGTTSPFAKFSINANNGDTNTTLFAIGSSTQSATTTLFAVSNVGNTTIAGNLAVGDATTTRANLGLAYASYTQNNWYNITGWGDSLTAGVGGNGVSYLTQLAADLPGVTTNDEGIGGQTSTQIAVREGGVATTATVSGGNIPASGSVTVTFPTGYEPVTSQGPGATYGTIAGVYGYVSLSGSTYSFTPTDGTTTVSTSGAVPFIPDVSNLNNGTVILWEGRNNATSPSQVESDIAGSVAALPTKNYLILSVENASGEGTGSGTYADITGINSYLASTYPGHYLDVREYLVQHGLADAGISPTSQDLTDISNDIPPTSLRYDNVHLNAAGYKVVAAQIAKWITSYNTSTNAVVSYASLNQLFADTTLPTLNIASQNYSVAFGTTTVTNPTTQLFTVASPNGSSAPGLTVLSTGLVGVGTSNPNSTLTVNGPSDPGGDSFTGTAHLGLFVTSSSYGLSGVDFGGANSSNPEARIAMNTTSQGSYLNFGTSDNFNSGITDDALTIDPFDNVLVNHALGIGTSTPLSQLDVSSQVTDSGNPTITIDGGADTNFTGSFGYIGTLQFFNNNAGNYGAAAAITAGRGQGVAGSGELHFLTNNGSGLNNSMTIDRAGDVGIGTGNPTSNLDINTGTGLGDILVGSDNSFFDGENVFSLNGNTSITSGNVTGMYTFNGGSNELFLNGSSGIEMDTGGTVTPLFVSPAGGLSVGNDYAGNNDASPTNGMIVEGHVGIGTDSPGATLDVEGGGYATSGVPNELISSSDAFATTLALSNTDTGGQEWDIDSHGSNRYDGVAAGSLSFVNANNGAEDLVISAADNVGIGTTTPGAKLDIADGAAQDLMLGQDTFPGDTAFNILSFNGSANDATALGFIGNNSGLIGVFPPGTGLSLNEGQILGGIFTAQAASNENFVINKAGDGNLQLVASNNAGTANIPLDIYASKYDFTGGNVGIGTTSPAAPLDIDSGASNDMVFGRVVGATTYNTISLNGSLSAASTLGLAGGANGDNNLYVQAPGSVAIGGENGIGTMFVNSTNVGIGTSVPNIAGWASTNHVLTIEGTGASGGDGNNGVLELATSEADGSGNLVGSIDFTDPANTGGGNEVAQIDANTSGTTANNRGGSLSFITKGNGTTGATRMTIASNGSVSIGTTSTSDIFSTNALTVQGANDTDLLNLTNGTSEFAVGLDTGTNVVAELGTVSNDNLGFFTNNGVMQFSLNTNGGAAIGTFAHNTGYQAPPANGLVVSGNTGVGTSSPFAKVSLQSNYGDSNNTVFSIASTTNSGGTLANGLFSIMSNGRVGVGTTSPFGKLAIQANFGETNLLLFNIASSSQGATTTLFSVSNTGLLTGLNFSLANGTTSGSLAITGSTTVKGVFNALGTINFGSNSLTLAELPQIAAGTFLANGTAATGNITAIATSTIFGLGTGGQILSWNKGVPQWIASTTYASGAGISTSFASGQLTITNTIGYPFPSNATSTQIAFNGGATFSNATSSGTFAATGSTTVSGIFNLGGLAKLNAGLTAYASSTIGNGTQAGGLTISGGATTTGNAYFAGRVGIGNTSSQGSLTVNENSAGGILLQGVTGNNSGNADLVLQNAAGTGSFDMAVTNGSNQFTIYDDNSSLTPFEIDSGTPNSTLDLKSNGNVGIGTSSPYALLSIGNTGGIGFGLATSTFNTTGGINLSAGCYALNGTCLPTSVSNLTTSYTVDSGSDNISVGDIVQYINGKARRDDAIEGTGVIGFGTSTAPVATATNVAVATLTSSSVAAAYLSGGNLFAVVCTVAANSFSCGTPVQFDSGSNDSVPSIAALSSTSFVMGFEKFSSEAYDVAATVSGTTITAGSITLVDSASTRDGASVAALSSTKFVMAFLDSTSGNQGEAMVATVSGTTITNGSNTTFGDTNYSDANVVPLSSTSFVVAWLNTGGPNVKAQAATVSGTTITGGSVTTLYTDSSSISGTGNFLPSSAAALGSSKFVYLFKYGYGSSLGAVVSTVSGTTVTPGSLQAITSDNTQNTSIAGLDSSDFVMLSDDVQSGVNHIYASTDSVSGTTITLGTNSILATATSTNDNTAVAALDTGHIVTGYIAGGSTGAMTLTVGALTQGTVLGMATNAAVANGTVSVASNGIITGLSGLTAGSTYYWDPAIGLTTNSSSYKVGIALTTTSILLNSNNTAGSDQFFGDAIFANDFRITEMAGNPQGLEFKNQLGQSIATLDEDGNLSLAGALSATNFSVSTSTGAVAISSPDITLGSASTSVVTINAGTVNFANPATTTISIGTDTWTIATSTATGTVPIISISAPASSTPSVSINGTLYVNGVDVGGSIASTSATTTPALLASGPFASATDALKSAISSALSAVQNIAQIGVRQLGAAVYASVGTFNNLFATTITATDITADTVNANKLCLGTTCVTESQLQNLLNGQSAGSGSGSGSGGDSATSTPPTITINGDNPANISVGDTYDDLGATATDNQGTSLDVQTFLQLGSDASSTLQLMSPIVLDTSAVATDTIYYVATDTWGNTATGTRTVIINPAQ